MPMQVEDLELEAEWGTLSISTGNRERREGGREVGRERGERNLVSAEFAK